MIRVKRLAALCLVLAVLLGVLPMEARAATNEEGIPVKPEAATLSEQPVLKILCIGNSDLYYNDLGGYIAAFGHKTEHKMIVVHAVHAGWGPRALMSGEISAYAWYATGKTVSARCDDIYNYDTTLDDVLDKDWGNLGREGEWDYIIFLNDPTREGGLSRLADGDSRMFHYVKDRLTAPENFIVLGYHWGDSNGAKANIEHKKAAAQDHFSVLVTGEYFSKVNRQWQNYFTIQDRWRHPSARAQYFNACSVYARLFGRENLASSEISAELIGLYNRKNGTSREFYRTIFARDSYVNDKAQNIDINAARKIQSTIYQNYDGVMGLQVASTQTELLELDAPELESALADGGIQIAWNQIDGAAKYRLFY